MQGPAFICSWVSQAALAEGPGHDFSFSFFNFLEQRFWAAKPCWDLLTVENFKKSLLKSLKMLWVCPLGGRWQVLEGLKKESQIAVWQGSSQKMFVSVSVDLLACARSHLSSHSVHAVLPKFQAWDDPRNPQQEGWGGGSHCPYVWPSALRMSIPMGCWPNTGKVRLSWNMCLFMSIRRVINNVHPTTEMSQYKMVWTHVKQYD